MHLSRRMTIKTCMTPLRQLGLDISAINWWKSGKAGCDVLFNIQIGNSDVLHKLKYGFHVVCGNRQCFSAQKTDYN